MANVKVLGAIVTAAAALSSTAALAQSAFSNPDLCEAESANCQVVGQGSWSPNNWGAGAGGPRHRRTAHRQPAARADVGWTGAAVAPAGTAAAIASVPFNVQTAPYRGWGSSYAAYGQPPCTTQTAGPAGTAAGTPTRCATASFASPAPISRVLTAPDSPANS